MHHIQLMQIHTNTTTIHNLQLCNTTWVNLISWTSLSRYPHIVKHYDYCWNIWQPFEAGIKVFSYNVTTRKQFLHLCLWLIIGGSYEMISTTIIVTTGPFHINMNILVGMHWFFTVSCCQSKLTVSAENNQTNVYMWDILFLYEYRLAACFKPVSSMIITLPCCIAFCNYCLSFLTHLFCSFMQYRCSTYQTNQCE